MTTGERLAYLAKISGSAKSLLATIGSGITVGAALVDYSGLLTGTALEHLFVDHIGFVRRRVGVFTNTSQNDVHVVVESNSAYTRRNTKII